VTSGPAKLLLGPAVEIRCDEVGAAGRLADLINDLGVRATSWAR
jgi:hypothetical protein